MGQPTTSIWHRKPQLDDIVKTGHAAQLSFAGISKRINLETGVLVSRNAVISRARRLKLPARDRLFVPCERIAKPRMVKLPRRPVMVAPPPELAPVSSWSDLPAPRYLGFHELRTGDCRYPFGHKPFIAYCGRRTGGPIYCPEHQAITHQDHTPRTRWS